jgi:hypothetical protein
LVICFFAFLISLAYADARARINSTDVVERGFEPTVLVSGPVAMVWYPCDFYRDGDWCHFGVDIFNLIAVSFAFP